jgi:hypothetical protein
MNHMLSIIGLLLIFLQPVAAGLLIVHKTYQVIYYLIFALWAAMYLWLSAPINFTTTIASNGHLRWRWLEPRSSWLIILWTLMIIAAIYLSDISAMDSTLVALFILALTGLSYYYYSEHGGAWGSVYCSFINVMFAIIIGKAFMTQYKCWFRRGNVE